MLQRIKDLFHVLFGWAIESAENRVPLERRLASDRQKRAARVNKMMDKATDIGEEAELMAQSLAESRIEAANLQQQVRSHLEVAKRAQAQLLRNPEDTAARSAMEEANAAAASLADEYAEAEAEVKEWEEMVTEQTQDATEARGLILDHARQLQKLARGDARLVSRVRINEMRAESLALREQLLQLIPEDQTNIRSRVTDHAKRQEARTTARKRIVDDLYNQQRKGRLAAQTQVSARGAEILQQIQGEVGYNPNAEQQAEEANTQRLSGN